MSLLHTVFDRDNMAGVMPYCHSSRPPESTPSFFDRFNVVHLFLVLNVVFVMCSSCRCSQETVSTFGFPFSSISIWYILTLLGMYYKI